MQNSKKNHYFFKALLSRLTFFSTVFSFAYIRTLREEKMTWITLPWNQMRSLYNFIVKNIESNDWNRELLWVFVVSKLKDKLSVSRLQKSTWKCMINRGKYNKNGEEWDWCIVLYLLRLIYFIPNRIFKSLMLTPFFVLWCCLA